MSPDTRYYCRTYTGDDTYVTSTTSSTMDDGGWIIVTSNGCIEGENRAINAKYIDAKLQAEKREGWLKPHKQLNPITYSVNGMIDRLINNRVREPG